MQRAAIVTGSSSGIGAATVRQLAALGVAVAINYATSADAAETVVADARAAGVDAFARAGDVADDAACRALADAAFARFGRLDYLVNNAGTTVFNDAANLDGLGAADFQHIYGVNVVGAYQMTRACVPHMRATGAGAIVNVSSLAGLYGIGSSLAYAASKGALNTLTLGLARALGPQIRVNAVAPGAVTTKWLAEGLGAQRYEALIGHVEARAPLREATSPDDVAAAIVWLLRGARSTTGEIVKVDAGTNLMIG